MLKLALTFCLTLCIFNAANAALTTATPGRYSNPAYPGKCVIKQQAVAPGQTIKHPIMACTLFTCDNADGMGTLKQCAGLAAIAPPVDLTINIDPADPPLCKWAEALNPNAEFPGCCERNHACVL